MNKAHWDVTWQDTRKQKKYYCENMNSKQAIKIYVTEL